MHWSVQFVLVCEVFCLSRCHDCAAGLHVPGVSKSFLLLLKERRIARAITQALNLSTTSCFHLKLGLFNLSSDFDSILIYQSRNNREDMSLTNLGDSTAHTADHSELQVTPTGAEEMKPVPWWSRKRYVVE